MIVIDILVQSHSTTYRVLVEEGVEHVGELLDLEGAEEPLAIEELLVCKCNYDTQ